MTNSAYCTRCRKKVTIKNPKETTLSNGRPVLKGTCGTCGGKVSRFLAKSK